MFHLPWWDFLITAFSAGYCTWMFDMIGEEERMADDCGKNKKDKFKG